MMCLHLHSVDGRIPNEERIVIQLIRQAGQLCRDVYAEKMHLAKRSTPLKIPFGLGTSAFKIVVSLHRALRPGT
jgi:hypothetical protein